MEGPTQQLEVYSRGKDKFVYYERNLYKKNHQPRLPSSHNYVFWKCVSCDVRLRTTFSDPPKFVCLEDTKHDHEELPESCLDGFEPGKVCSPVRFETSGAPWNDMLYQMAPRDQIGGYVDGDTDVLSFKGDQYTNTRTVQVKCYRSWRCTKEGCEGNVVATLTNPPIIYNQTRKHSHGLQPDSSLSHSRQTQQCTPVGVGDSCSPTEPVRPMSAYSQADCSLSSSDTSIIESDPSYSCTEETSSNPASSETSSTQADQDQPCTLLEGTYDCLMSYKGYLFKRHKCKATKYRFWECLKIGCKTKIRTSLEGPPFVRNVKKVQHNHDPVTPDRTLQQEASAQVPTISPTRTHQSTSATARSPGDNMKKMDMLILLLEKGSSMNVPSAQQDQASLEATMGMSEQGDTISSVAEWKPGVPIPRAAKRQGQSSEKRPGAKAQKPPHSATITRAEGGTSYEQSFTPDSQSVWTPPKKQEQSSEKRPEATAQKAPSSATITRAEGGTSYERSFTPDSQSVWTPPKKQEQSSEKRPEATAQKAPSSATITRPDAGTCSVDSLSPDLQSSWTPPMSGNNGTERQRNGAIPVQKHREKKTQR